LQSVQFQRDVALRVLEYVRGGSSWNDDEPTHLEIRKLIAVCFNS
jgi:hypothetical protein